MADDTAATTRSSSSDYLQPATSTDGGKARLFHETGDGAEPIADGAVLSLGQGLSVAVSLTPYPPTSFDAVVDMYLTSSTGDPVPGAAVTAVWDMVFMWHGPFVTDFEDRGGGHYSASFDFFMFGPWQLTTTVHAPGVETSEEVVLSIYVWPE